MSTKHTTAYYSRTDRFRDKRRELVRSIKSRPCADCGHTFPHYIMEFDHVPERGEKAFHIGCDAAVVSLERLMAEIAKCDLVCANCHKARTYFRGGGEGDGN